MYRRILHISCVLFLAIVQSGCVGLFPYECKRETPFTGYHNVIFNTGALSPGENPRVSTKKMFLDDWGKPDEIIMADDNVETWVYKRKLWCGPFPLIFPVCDGYDRVEFRGSEAIRLHTKFTIVVDFPFDSRGIARGHDPNSSCRYPIVYGPVFSKIDKIPENTGAVYFYASSFSHAFRWRSNDLKMGETVITRIYQNGYYPYLSEPGEKKFWLVNNEKESVKIDVKPGQTYYVKYEFLNSFPSLVVVPPEVAETEITKCKLMLAPD